MVELCFLERGTEPRASKQPKGIAQMMKRDHSQEELYVDCNHSTGQEASGQRPVCDQDAPRQNPESSRSSAIPTAQSASSKGGPSRLNFVPNEESLEFALLLCPDLDPELELVAFLKYRRSKSANVKDLNRLFRLWLRRSQDSIDERRRRR